jgi:hypothetical protein
MYPSMLSWRPCSPCLTFSLLLVVAPVSPVLEAGEPHPSPEVNQAIPQGAVKHVRQAGARFSEPMVPFGDPRSRADPFAIDCPEVGAGRWVDSRTWVDDYAHDLLGDVGCRFKLRPGDNPGRDARNRPGDIHLYNWRSIDPDVHPQSGFDERSATVGAHTWKAHPVAGR